MNLRKAAVGVALVALAVVAASCTKDSTSSSSNGDATTTTAAATGGTTATTMVAVNGSDTGPADTSKMNIVQIASSVPAASTVTRLVIAAGLEDTLLGTGPFTVFAPANSAFAKLPPATLQSVRSDIDGALTTVLTLHVVPGLITTDQLKADAANGTALTTVQGGKLKVEMSGNDIVVGGAKIVVPDVKGTNGVIHVIDSVITAPNA